MTIARQGRRAFRGGGGYLPGIATAFEFDEVVGGGGIVTDSVAGKTLTLGSSMSTSGGNLLWPAINDSTTTTAVSDDTTTYIDLNTEFSIEVFVKFSAVGAGAPAVSTIKMNGVNGLALYLSNISTSYGEVTFGNNTIKSTSASGLLVVNTPYHVVVTFAGAGSYDPDQFIFYINGTKHIGSLSGNLSSPLNLNLTGMSQNNTQGAGTLGYERRYTRTLTDAEALQLYENRGSL